MKAGLYVFLAFALATFIGWRLMQPYFLTGAETEVMPLDPDLAEIPEGSGVATVGGGCFWCVEEVFHQTDGVLSAVSGYMGGSAGDADYSRVASGRTEHAEVVQVHFDPEVITYIEVLDRFFESHDPTQLDRQGPDKGPQYRSVIFYHDDVQKLAAESKIRELAESGEFRGDIVTEVVEAMEFYEAEDYHQNYARENPGNGYLRAVLYPKLKKLGVPIPVKDKPAADGSE